jgi:uracil-DNA glycosylase
MPTVVAFDERCQRFFLREIEIVAPRVVVALGGDTGRRVAKAAPGDRWLAVMHPSAREFKPLASRNARVAGEALKIEEFVAVIST